MEVMSNLEYLQKNSKGTVNINISVDSDFKISENDSSWLRSNSLDVEKFRLSVYFTMMETIADFYEVYNRTLPFKRGYMEDYSNIYYANKVFCNIIEQCRKAGYQTKELKELHSLIDMRVDEIYERCVHIPTLQELIDKCGTAINDFLFKNPNSEPLLDSESDSESDVDSDTSVIDEKEE